MLTYLLTYLPTIAVYHICAGTANEMVNSDPYTVVQNRQNKISSLYTTCTIKY